MRYVQAAVLVLVLIGGCQCDDDMTDVCAIEPVLCQQIQPIQVFVDVASTTPQSGLTSGVVASPPAVRITSSAGGLVSCFVTFEVTQGGGLLGSTFPIAGGPGMTSAYSATDANGVARTSEWRLGPTAGPNQARVNFVSCTTPLVANVVIRTGTFDAMAVAPVPASITKVAGDGQSGTAGEVVAVEPRVLVLAQQNTPMANAQVTFRVQTGGGSVNNAPLVVVNTDGTGHASAPLWRLGPLVGSGPGAGVNELEASVASLSPVVFTATSQAGAPLSVSAVSAPSITPANPTVLVVDANGNPVPNVNVLFAVTAGGGAVTPGTVVTDAFGRASTTWTFGPQAGTLNRVTATVLRNGQPDPAVQGNPVTFEHTPVATGSICVYIDVYGEPLANVPVTATGPDTRTGNTDSDGVITFSGLTPGTYTVTIVPPPGVTFNATSQQVVVVAGQTPAVFFEGFGAAASKRRPPLTHAPASR